MRIEDWTESHADEVSGWRYPSPYDFYDLASDPADEADIRDPGRREHYRAVLADEDERLDAFWYFDWPGDVVEVGLGLRPELTGHGRGESFLSAQLAHAAENWHPTAFRLFVAAWNERAIRLYKRFDFREVGRETRRFELVGEHEFVQMERAA